MKKMRGRDYVADRKTAIGGPAAITAFFRSATSIEKSPPGRTDARHDDKESRGIVAPEAELQRMNHMLYNSRRRIPILIAVSVVFSVYWHYPSLAVADDSCIDFVWRAYNACAYGECGWDEVIRRASECERQLASRAIQLQTDLELKRELPPATTHPSERDKRSIFQRGPLNDVATALFLKGKAAAFLAEAEYKIVREAVGPGERSAVSNDPDAKIKERVAQIVGYREVRVPLDARQVRHYQRISKQAFSQAARLTYARAWDPGGFFWEPAYKAWQSLHPRPLAPPKQIIWSTSGPGGF